MNRKLIPVVIIFCVIFAAEAGAFTEKRSQWWKIRAEHAAKERDEMAKIQPSSPLILQLLDRDIARSTDMASLFSGTDNAAAGTALPNTGQRSSAAGEIIPAVHASYALRFCADAIPSKERTSEIMPLLRNAIRPLFTAKDLTADDQFLDAWLKKILTENERIFITSECIAAAVNAGKDKTIRAATAHTESVLTDRKDASVSDIRKAITEAACTFFNAYDFKKETVFTDTMIMQSSLWKKIESAAKDEALRLGNARDIIGRSSAENDAQKLSTLCAHSDEFAVTAFRRLSTQYCDVRTFPRSGNSSVKIPSEPDMPALLNEIDAVRISILSDNKASLPEDAMRRADAQIQQCIARIMKSPADAFFRQEEKSRILAGDEAAAPDAPKTMDPDLTAARSIFRDQVNAAHAYRKATVRYIGFALDKNSRSGTAALTGYISRCDAQKKLMENILSLSRSAAQCAIYPDSAAKHIYTALHQRERALYDYCLSQSALSQDDRLEMDRQQLADALKKRESLSAQYTTILKEAASLHTAFAAGSGTFARKEKTQEKLDDAALAQQEITLLAGSVKEYADAYQAMNYSKDAFEAYELFFNMLYREADSGQISENLLTAIKHNSLIPMVKGFDPEMLKNQSRQRIYIKKAVLRDTARLKTLIDFYKRQKTDIKDYPPAEEIRAIEAGLTARPTVQISQWKMTETNFTEIDYNAAKILSNIRKRNAWKSGAGSTPAADRIEQIPQSDMTLSIPDGFDAKTVSSELPSVVKQFSSQDNLSSIYVAIVPLLGKSDREAAEQWLIKAGKKTVKSSACRTGIGSYYWNLAKDEHRNISETYALVHGESLVIISGETSKERYPFFREKMSAVFKSLSR